ncbi:OsmC family protein [Candidatus Zinderia endosymbiont of Aphrophora alni]|uniref:OsmC family protein n=1 Tax=Candidatus Zinderia endosymbiont of Aphrophora alni TaxID=3077951 RepID=UPI0030D1481D
MNCTIKWTNFLNLTLTAKTDSKHIICMDGDPKNGGQNLAPRPMEMILIGAGGCTTYDIILILKKNKQNIKKCKIKIKSKRAKQNPKIFTKIHFKFYIYGKNLNKNIIKNAIKLSHSKYCSAIIMLNKSTKITHSLKIINT